jgi:hypothetical protein
MPVNPKPKQYTTETIARARRVQADVDELRSRFDDPRNGSLIWVSTYTDEGRPDERVSDVLCRLYDSLGTTPDDVANTLGAMGVRGVVLGERCCPLANLGRMATGLWTHIASGRYAIVDRQSDPLWYWLPQACAQMMLQFDCGDYPWLEREAQGDEGAVQLASEEATHGAA